MVFIVDSDFESCAYSMLANDCIIEQFNNLEPNDYFGYISLGKSIDNNEIILEEKEN